MMSYASQVKCVVTLYKTKFCEKYNTSDSPTPTDIRVHLFQKFCAVPSYLPSETTG
jgi:hypothetical protein